jgi:neutral ceramidase
LPPLNIRLSDGLRLRPWIAAQLVSSRQQTFLQGFRLDKSIWISTPCDFSGELALEVKHAVQASGHSAVVTSFNGDYVGYVIPARYYHLNGYEPRTMSFFGPNVPDYFQELIGKIAFSLSRD